MIDRRFSVAPMLDWTDRYCRFFLRLISQRALLYTEMITTAALLHRGPDHFLRFDASEHPLALQLGGSVASELADCAILAERWGYDEINLNVGCPSDRVQAGRFGACLMAEPELVADCLKAMSDAVGIAVTVKHRTGIDNRESYQQLCDFVGTLATAGVRTFIVHARSAWLQGLSPKENRNIPPLNYERVYRLKRDFSDLEIVINGGITTLEECEKHLTKVDGVMLGREAYHNPWILADVDRRIFAGKKSSLTRQQVVEKLIPFVQNEISEGMPLNRISRHILGLFHGQPGARAWRRHLSDHSHKREVDADLLLDAVAAMGQQRETASTID